MKTKQKHSEHYGILILYSKIPLLRPPYGPKNGLNWRVAVIEGRANFVPNGCNKRKSSMQPAPFQLGKNQDIFVSKNPAKTHKFFFQIYYRFSTDYNIVSTYIEFYV